MFRALHINILLPGTLMCLLLVSGASVAKSYKTPSGEILNDPTKPHDWQRPTKEKSAATRFELNYILNADSRKQAMVNGQKVVEGDYISGAKVLRIQEGAVTLLVEGQQKTLWMNKNRGIKQAK